MFASDEEQTGQQQPTPESTEIDEGLYTSAKKLPLEVDRIAVTRPDDELFCPPERLWQFKDDNWRVFGYAFLSEQFASQRHHQQRFFGDESYMHVSPRLCMRIIEEKYRLPTYRVKIRRVKEGSGQVDEKKVGIATAAAFGSNKTRQALEWLKTKECRELIERVKAHLGVEHEPTWYTTCHCSVPLQATCCCPDRGGR